MTVMRRPISCTNSIAMAFHVPAVSMAMGQKMCVLAKLAYLESFCCAATAAAPGVLSVLAIWDSAYVSIIIIIIIIIIIMVVWHRLT